MIGQTYEQYIKREEALDLAAQKSRPPRHLKLLSSIALFAFALLLRLWFNFSLQHPNCAGCCDASEYVRNAQALSNLASYSAGFWRDALCSLLGIASEQTVTAVRVALAPLHEVYQGGPIFPLFLLSCFSICSPFTGANSLVGPVLIQSILGAASCLLIAYTAGRAWDMKIGWLAGCIAAIYPAFIVNSGRLYSESFATFLACAILSLVVRGFTERGNRIWATILLGSLIAALQLTRSVMVLFSIPIFFITFFQNRQTSPKRSLIALAVGCACVLLPWMAMQKIALGKGGVIVDRVGNYNLFIGTNTDTQGWLSFPYPDGSGIEKKSLPSILHASEEHSPTRSLRLMSDKPARLFLLPWNDFKTPIGILSIAHQVLFHQMLLLLGAVGVFLTLLGSSTVAPPERSQIFSRLLILGFLALHLVYAFFITVPRYNLTAMPSLIMFAAAGIVALFRLFQDDPARRSVVVLLVASVVLLAGCRMNLTPFILLEPKTALTVGCALKAVLYLIWFYGAWTCISFISGYRRLSRMILLVCSLGALPLFCLPVRALGRWNEWQCPLERGQRVEQVIKLPRQIANAPAPSNFFLLIDADSERTLAHCDISVNGRSISAPIIPGLAMVENFHILKHRENGTIYWEGEQIFDSLSRPSDLTNADLRQWFFLPLPADVLKTGMAQGKFTVRLTSHESGGAIYGAYQVSPSRQDLPSVTTYSWEKAFYGVENDRGTTDPRLDDKIAVQDNPYDFDLSPSPGRQTGRYNIRILAAPASTNPNQYSLLDSKGLTIPPLSADTHEQSTVVTSELPDYSTDDLWTLRLRGKLRAASGSPKPSISVIATSKDTKLGTTTYHSPWTPTNMRCASTWTGFDVSVPLAPGQLPGKLSSINTTFDIDSPQWKAWKKQSLAGSSLEFKDVSMDIFHVPNGALNPGYRIF